MEQTCQGAISIVFPVYNEQLLLSPAVHEIDDFMHAHFSEYEIILIESGSTDDTGELCDKLSRELPTVSVIHEGSRNGFGSALKLGYSNAKYPYCWLLTADIPFPLESVLQAVPLLNSYDFILSYRSEDKRKWTRKIQSFVYNILVRIWFGLDVRCVNSGFKLLPTAVMQQMELTSNYWFIDAEIIYRLIMAGYSYTELPVPLIDRGADTNSSVGTFAFIKMLKEMFAFSRIRHTIPDERKRVHIAGKKGIQNER